MLLVVTIDISLFFVKFINLFLKLFLSSREFFILILVFFKLNNFQINHFLTQMLFPDYSKTYANHDLKVSLFFVELFFFTTRQMMQVKRYQKFNTTILIYEILLYKIFCCRKFLFKKRIYFNILMRIAVWGYEWSMLEMA